ncbi:MAG: hypothetical protein RR348_02525 [Clostridia bacterium]
MSEVERCGNRFFVKSPQKNNLSIATSWNDFAVVYCGSCVLNKIVKI